MKDEYIIADKNTGYLLKKIYKGNDYIIIDPKAESHLCYVYTKLANLNCVDFNLILHSVCTKKEEKCNLINFNNSNCFDDFCDNCWEISKAIKNNHRFSITYSNIHELIHASEEIKSEKLELLVRAFPEAKKVMKKLLKENRLPESDDFNIKIRNLFLND